MKFVEPRQDPASEEEVDAGEEEGRPPQSTQNQRHISNIMV